MRQTYILKKENKKGMILESTVVYLIIVLVFMAILFAFIYIKSSNTALIEEKTAKEIALILDSAKPDTLIILNVNDAIKKNEGVSNPISISGNIVNVKLSEKGGYSYSFFNKMDVESTLFQMDERWYLNIKIK